MERYQKKIEKAVYKWQHIMDLGFVAIQNEFSDEASDNIAQVVTNWEYREAAIIWYNEQCKDLTPDEVDRAAVHELSHILVAPMSDYLPNKHHKLEEFTVESIARAIIRARDYEV